MGLELLLTQGKAWLFATNLLWEEVPMLPCCSFFKGKLKNCLIRKCWLLIKKKQYLWT